METEIYEALKALNNNVARLVVTQNAIADELHMIRRAQEGEPGSYSDPVANEYENMEIHDDGVPEFV